MLNTQKTYNVEFYTNVVYYYMKDNQINELAGESLIGGRTKHFSNSEEALDFIENSLKEKMSSFVITENKDELDFFEEISKNIEIKLEDLDRKRIIILKQKSLQLVLNNETYIDIPDIKVKERLMENFEKMLLSSSKKYELDTEYNVKSYL
jgi:hypothetical protein